MRNFLLCSILFIQVLFGNNYNIRWGTDAGPASAIFNDFAASPWTNNPSPIQLLKDFSGTALNNTTGGPDSSWTKGDLIELGFFADLGDDNALGGSDANADSASSTLFSGTWIPITSETYIGQDWGGSESWHTVPEGEFAFVTQFSETDGNWNANAVSNQGAEAAYQIQTGDDTPANLTSVLPLLSTSTPLGIRFYDSTTKVDATTSYNTVMSAGWTWPSASGTLEMTLHTDTASTNNLDSNLRFEFDNTNYGTNNGSASIYAKKTTSDTAVSTTAIPGTATNPTSDDFVTTITYLSDTYLNSNNLDLSDSGGKGSMVVNGLTGTSTANFINGGSGTAEEHQLTINTNTSTSFTFAGGIAGVADGSSSTDLTILKTGAGAQTLTGAVNLSDAVSDGATSGFIYIKEGTIVAKPTSGGTQSIEYLAGDSGSTLTLDSTGAGASGKVIELGFANTSSAKTFAGNINLAGNTGGVTLDVGGGTNFDANQIVSGSITEDGASNFVLRKTGSGKLTLNGDSSSDFAGGITIADGGGTKDGGILVAGHNNALGTGTTTIEHGKLAIGAGTTVTITSDKIKGQATNDNTNMKSVIGGGVGNSAGVIDNDGSDKQINIGSADGQIDVLSPGIAHASSMSNGTSDYQVVAGNEGLLTNSIGTIQIDKIGLKSGGVFDWEITDFSGNNADGSDWDVLKFDTLDFDATNDTFDINIYSLASNGSAGGVTGDYGLGVNKTGTSGFKFMEWTGSGTPNGTTEGWLGDQTARQVNAFNVNSDNWAYQNNFYYGDWSVWYEGGSFYLQYSAVPEPSTYFMVTGLLMLPGYNFIRRFRKKNVANGVVENSTESTL